MSNRPRFSFKRPMVGGRMILVAMILLMGLFVALVTSGSSRSFLIEAETGTLELTFGDGNNFWRLPSAQRCEPVDLPRRNAEDICGDAFAPVGTQDETFLVWKTGSKVRLQTVLGQGLTISIIAGMTPEYIDGSKVIVPEADLPDVGALTFQAAFSLGADMASGVQEFLISGRWEAREAGHAVSVLRSQTEVVKSGMLSAGTTVSVFDGEERVQGFGHIIIGPPTTNMNTSLVTQSGDTALELRYFGVEEPVRIKPDWVDIALASPLLLAVAAIFSVLASVSQIFSDTGVEGNVIAGIVPDSVEPEADVGNIDEFESEVPPASSPDAKPN